MAKQIITTSCKNMFNMSTCFNKKRGEKEENLVSLLVSTVHGPNWGIVLNTNLIMNKHILNILFTLFLRIQSEDFRNVKSYFLSLLGLEIVK